MSCRQNGTGTNIKASNRLVNLEQFSELQSTPKQPFTYMFEAIHGLVKPLGFLQDLHPGELHHMVFCKSLLIL